MNIIEALSDRNLFGGLSVFHDLTTWRPWLVFLSAIYGLPLSPEDQQIFCQHTGRSVYTPRPGGYPETIACIGRQSGKTRIAGTILGYEAIRPTESDGTNLYAVAICQDQRSSLRTLFSYACAPFEQIPLLTDMVSSQMRESLALDNGCTLAAYPCRPAAVRGIRARVVVLDELAFYRTSENFPVDQEMLRAVRPCVATTGGKIIILSSPYGQSGVLFELHRKYYGHDDSDTLVWQASAPEMNCTLPADYLTRMQQDDPEAYASEVLGQFRAGVSAFLDPAAIAACVAEGVREVPPAHRVTYSAFADVSGGRHDRFVVAVGHCRGELAVLDAFRAWTPPFNPAGVIEEACEFLRRYRIVSISGDRYAGEFVAEQFRKHGITYQASEWDRSGIYMELQPLLNAGRVSLLDQPELLRELRGLERRRGHAGKDRIDHGSGGKDDIANAVSGVIVMAATQQAVSNEYGGIF